ncbi:MAG: lipopolysaccharide heptosyltransferase [Pseudomonadota bacterium]
MSPTRVLPVAHTAERSTSLNQAAAPTDTEHRDVLVIAPQWVGDAIVALPLISELARHHSAVDVLAVPAVSAVFECAPCVRRVITVPFAHGKLQWTLRRQTARGLRGRYSTAVILPNSLKAALIPWLARIPLRRALTGEFPRRLLLTDARCPPTARAENVHRNSRVSMLDQYLWLAPTPLPQASIDRYGTHRPRMTLPDNVSLDGDFPNAPAHSKDPGLLALCPGAEYGPAKQWPAEHFAAVANAWCAQSHHHRVVLIGGPKETGIAAEIAGQCARPEQVISMAGKTTLLQAFAWIARAGAAVSNDSGLMHAAAALDVPVIGVFGSSDPLHTPPLHPRARALSLSLPCSPCFQRTCPLGTTACLRDLSAEQVITALRAQAAPA